MKLTASYIIFIVIIALICSVHLSSQDFMYWESDFNPIVLPNLTTREGQSDGGSNLVALFTSGNVEISADNSTNARLDGPGGDYLITKYKLNFDGDGVTQTGAPNGVMTEYNEFLVPPVQITHVVGDDDVGITLEVRAMNAANDLANAGDYTAIQTLTAHWVGP